MFNKTLLILFLFCIFAISVFAQTYGGKITQVIDGRTAVLSSENGGKAIILLQFLEVPEPEQQLSKICKEHLESLVLGKEVRFEYWKSYSQGWIGRLFLNETEINQQMLRDGAAWFNLPEFEGIGQEHIKIENLAKFEKRGIWAVQGLKPAWEFRAERYAKKIEEQEQIERLNLIEAKKKNPQTETIWANIPGSKSETENNSESIFDPNREITFEYDEFKDEGYAFSPAMVLRESGYGSKIFCFKYHYFGNSVKKGGSEFEVAIMADEADEIIFLTAKGERFNIGTGYRPAKSAVSIYKINRAALSKISDGEYAFVKVGVSKYTLDKSILGAIKRLLKAT